LRALLTVAGDELRKDGGNKTNPGASCQPHKTAERLGSESRNPVCGFLNNLFSFEEKPC